MASERPEKVRKQAGRVDWTAALTGWGFGLACMSIGGVVYWSAATGRPGGPSGNALTTSQRIVATLPDPWKQKLALVFAAVMFIGGILLFGISCYGFVKDLQSRRQ